VLIAVALSAFAAWTWLNAVEAPPERSDFVLDLERIRALAEVTPGPKPSALRSALIAEAELPRGGVFAGEPFEPHVMAHQVFQVVWPDRFLLVDPGFSKAFHAAQMKGGRPYHEEVWRALQVAVAGAENIVVTHEHADHLEGVARFQPPESLVGRLWLTKEQLGNEARLDEVDFPAVLRERLQPLEYEDLLEAGPGVVLIKAAGHTPGSQMVYVQLASGTEILLLGDVAWHLDQVRNLHYRPRLVTDWFLNEDRAAVLHQFRALHDLMAAEPAIELVPSHDPEVRARLVAAGTLADGLVR
jgi:glyoxylase-like metal-dependent hydrolase (beta-lactamase superfamily II)